MRRVLALSAAVAVCLPLLNSALRAQPPGAPPQGGRGAAAPNAESFLQRLMQYDANGDGSLTLDEVKDRRLHALLNRADANEDGVVTKAELTALHQKESAAIGRQPAGFPPPGAQQPPGAGRGGPPGAQPGPGAGPGPQRRGGRAGQILPEFVQDELELSPEQREQVAELQKEVDAQLEKILTPEQRALLNQPRPGGPGGRQRPPGAGPGRPNGEIREN
ncbi:MAG: EF-hand domain-containing protein [Planctomyces sp.]|nr:EF-hand domain-containing protein [Planctomyces sp.]